MTKEFIVQVAGLEHIPYAEDICALIENAAKQRGTGIAKRDPEYIRGKIREGKAVVALCGKDLAGFCYIETWSHGKYVANSGLIVSPTYRNAFRLAAMSWLQAPSVAWPCSRPCYTKRMHVSVHW